MPFHDLPLPASRDTVAGGPDKRPPVAASITWRGQKFDDSGLAHPFLCYSIRLSRLRQYQPPGWLRLDNLVAVALGAGDDAGWIRITPVGHGGVGVRLTSRSSYARAPGNPRRPETLQHDTLNLTINRGLPPALVDLVVRGFERVDFEISADWMDLQLPAAMRPAKAGLLSRGQAGSAPGSAT